MRKTDALYLKTQRLIAQTHRYTKRDTQRHRQTQTDAHRETHTKRHTQRDRHTHTKRHIQRHASAVYPSFCLTHES